MLDFFLVDFIGLSFLFQELFFFLFRAVRVIDGLIFLIEHFIEKLFRLLFDGELFGLVISEKIIVVFLAKF